VEATTIPGRNSKNPPTSFFLSVCEPSSGEADLQQPPPHLIIIIVSTAPKCNGESFLAALLLQPANRLGSSNKNTPANR
jgi:hypothetical protein